MNVVSSSRGYARSTASMPAPGSTARAAASCSIQNAVIDEEYFSALPTDAANRRSVSDMRSSARSIDGDSAR